MPKPGTKVAEVDKAKRDAADLSAKEEYMNQLIADLEAKKAEYEKQMEEQIKKYMEPDPELQPKRVVKNPFKPVDYTDIPEVAYKSTSPSEIAWRKDNNMQYRMVRYKGSMPRVAAARAKGWRPLFWVDSFEGTDFFEKTNEGYVLVGDLIIMQMPKDEYQNRIVAQKKAMLAAREQSAEEMFHHNAEEISRATGQRVQTFKHKGSGRNDDIEYIT
jgi:hypothetical protein